MVKRWPRSTRRASLGVGRRWICKGYQSQKNLATVHRMPAEASSLSLTSTGETLGGFPLPFLDGSLRPPRGEGALEEHRAQGTGCAGEARQDAGSTRAASASSARAAAPGRRSRGGRDVSVVAWRASGRPGRPRPAFWLKQGHGRGTCCDTWPGVFRGPAAWPRGEASRGPHVHLHPDLLRELDLLQLHCWRHRICSGTQGRLPAGQGAGARRRCAVPPPWCRAAP